IQACPLYRRHTLSTRQNRYKKLNNYLELKYDPRKKNYSHSYDLNCSKIHMQASMHNCLQYSVASPKLYGLGGKS
ncbi:hypothetical protein VIGAN_08119900, partial [Vigna angularis var. angularis]